MYTTPDHDIPSDKDENKIKYVTKQFKRWMICTGPHVTTDLSILLSYNGKSYIESLLAHTSCEPAVIV